MTKAERREAGAAQRLAQAPHRAGAGVTVQEVNRLLKQHRQMQDMMKRVRKMGGLQNLQQMMGRGGGLPPGFLPPR